MSNDREEIANGISNKELRARIVELKSIILEKKDEIEDLIKSRESAMKALENKTKEYTDYTWRTESIIESKTKDYTNLSRDHEKIKKYYQDSIARLETAIQKKNEAIEELMNERLRLLALQSNSKIKTDRLELEIKKYRKRYKLLNWIFFPNDPKE